MIHYILQFLAFQLLFLVVYDLFLKKETFFNINRGFLLITPIVSLLVPFIKIPVIEKNVPAEFAVTLPPIVLEGEPSLNGLTHAYTGGMVNLSTLWWVGVGLSMLFFLYKLYKIYRLKRTGEISKTGRITLIKLPNTDVAFTFFKTIFLGTDLSETQQKHIVMHEQVHANQHHSIDLLYFEVLRILFWFNPLVYVYQKRMVSLQEFIADAEVAKQQNKKDYYQSLLSQVFQTEKISFINTFFNHSLIKNRIVMLQKSKSKNIFKLKYLLLIPIVGGMLLYSSCTQNASAQDADNNFVSASQEESEILQNIAELKESIAKKGEMTPEEEDALKVLYVLTNPDGLETDAYQDVKDKVHIPFGVIQKVPVYPGCEGLSAEASKKCFTKKVSTLVGKEFNTKVAGPEVNGKQRIVVKFTIGRDGTVKNIAANAKHIELREEAERVLKTLPKMIPGEHQGKKVGVEYSLPILFDIK